MWCKRAHILASLTKLCLTKVNLEWTNIENDYFIEMKKILGRDFILYYLNFSERFIINTDDSKMQLGGVIIQNGKPIYFWSHKLTPDQINYTTIERELLSRVENLEIFPYNPFRTLYNSIYGPQEPKIWELHNRKSATLEPYVGSIRSQDKIYQISW